MNKFIVYHLPIHLSYLQREGFVNVELCIFLMFNDRSILYLNNSNIFVICARLFSVITIR